MNEQVTTFDHAADDEKIDRLFERLLSALENGHPDRLSLWRELEGLLRAHMDDEEQRVTPRLAAIRLRDALAILQEHRYLRARLQEIGEGIVRGDTRLVSVRPFRDELRAHARHEEAILRRLRAEGD